MNQHSQEHWLDCLAMRYLLALDQADFAVLDDLWKQAEHDDDVAEMLHGLNAAYLMDWEQETEQAITDEVAAAVKEHLPSAEIDPQTKGVVLVADVAELLRQHPPRGLSVDDLRMTERLLTTRDEVPGDMAVSKVIAWGQHYGPASETYWKAFRAAALKLRLQRESAVSYQLATRPRKPKSSEDKS